MKRALWSIIGIISVASLLYYVLRHENIERATHLQTELSRLEGENQQLSDENVRLQRRILALRDDPRLAERRAREAGRMAKPNEVIYQFDSEKKAETIEVLLIISPDRCQLAGKTQDCRTLTAALLKLGTEIPTASLAVSYKEGVDAIERQRVKDAIAAAKIPSTELAK